MNNISYLRASNVLYNNLYKHSETQVIKNLLSTNVVRGPTSILFFMQRPPTLLKNRISYRYTHFRGIHKMNLKYSNAFIMARTYSTRHTNLSSSQKIPNLYDVLEVSPKANHSEIKSAFYNLSKTYHPDVNKTQEAVTKFAEILSAYEILGNQTKRRMYDRGTMMHPRFGVSPRKETQEKDDRHYRRPMKPGGVGQRPEGSGPSRDFKSASGRPAFKFDADFQDYCSTSRENRTFTRLEAEHFMKKHHEDEKTRKFRGISTAVIVFSFLTFMLLSTQFDRFRLRNGTSSTLYDNKKE